MNWEQIITELVDVLAEFSGLLASSDNKYDAYILVNDYLKKFSELKDELADIVRASMEDSDLKSAVSRYGRVNLIESNRVIVTGDRLAERAGENVHALNVHMLLDALRAASAIKTEQMSSAYMKQLAAEVGETKIVKYLAVRKR